MKSKSLIGSSVWGRGYAEFLKGRLWGQWGQTYLSGGEDPERGCQQKCQVGIERNIEWKCFVFCIYIQLNAEKPTHILTFQEWLLEGDQDHVSTEGPQHHPFVGCVCGERPPLHDHRVHGERRSQSVSLSAWASVWVLHIQWSTHHKVHEYLCPSIFFIKLTHFSSAVC